MFSVVANPVVVLTRPGKGGGSGQIMDNNRDHEEGNDNDRGAATMQNVGGIGPGDGAVWLQLLPVIGNEKDKNQRNQP
jgi:hypothetical protein